MWTFFFKSIHTLFYVNLNELFPLSLLICPFERVTGMKAMDLQREETGCKCQNVFYLPLQQQGKKTTSVRFFSFSIQN